MKKIALTLMLFLPSSFALAQQKVQYRENDASGVEHSLDVSDAALELPEDYAEVSQKIDAMVLKRTGKRMFEQPVSIEWKENDVSVSVKNPRTGKQETIKVSRHSGCC